MVHVQALGAVSIVHDGREVSVGGPRQRRLLAMLLIHRNAVVSVDRLADAVFAGAPTPAAATTLRSYVARIRRVLATTADGPVVVTQAPGYLLTVPDDVFDVARFEAALHESRSSLREGEPASAARRLRGALALWRGDAYAEFDDEDWARPEAQRLAELRLVAHEILFEAELAAGRTVEVIAEIESMVDQHPTREALVAQLMTAQYRAGRQADALRTYRRHRAVLVEELGLDPTPAMQALEARVLDNDPELLAADTGGQALRGYRLGERLGTGRDGTVFAAHLPGVDRDLVIRVHRSELADDEAFVRGFENMAHRIASLRHPAIVPIQDYWREPGAAYLVMRRMHGGSLADRLARPGRPIGDDEAAEIARRLADALSAAHGVGVTHGDITAGNVLFDGAGRAHLGDFDPRGRATVEDDDDALDALVRECLGGVAPTQGRPSASSVPNPYKGLAAFEESDAEDFFGRGELVDELVARLHHGDLQGRLVLVVGGSGTGKSSVVRAGLLPRIRRGDVPGSDRWFVTTMSPGAAPFKELGAALRRVAVTEPDGLPGDLSREGGIDDAIRRLVPGTEQLLVVVDQFEELFTSSPADVQRRFLDGLMYAVSAPDSRLRVVLTLRADFYDRPLASPSFGSAVNAATVTVPAMSPADLEAAIVSPAKRSGRAVESPLVAELVAAAVDEPAGLPALQFTLFELAERCDGDLTVAAYRELGGLTGAIATRAETLYQSLDEADRGRIRRLFEQLVLVSPDGEPTRRRPNRAELVSDEPGLDDVIDQWSEARLLSLDRDPQSRLPTVEPAHEALLREWPRLRAWIEEHREELLVRGHVREAAASWIGLDRDPGALYRGARLQTALDVVPSANLGAQELEFLDASAAARDAEASDAAAAIERTERANRRLRWQLLVIGVALVVALVGGAVAVDQRREAVDERRTAFARELAAAADANVAEDPERAMLLALEAIDVTRRADGSVRLEAVEALHNAVSRARIVLDVDGLGGSIDWSPDGSHFVSEGVEDSGVVDLRDARTGESVRSFVGHDVDINEVAFSSDGSMFATTGDDGYVRVWDTDTGAAVVELTAPGAGSAWATAFSPGDDLIAASWSDLGTVTVFDLGTGSVVSDFEWPAVHGLAFSPDGAELAAGSIGQPGVLLVDPRTGETTAWAGADTAPGRDPRFSPDGRWLASGNSDGEVNVWDAATHELRFSGRDHSSEVNTVAWSADSTRIASGGNDGTLRVHELSAGGLHEIVATASRDTASGIASVDFSPDGDEVMTGDWAVDSVQVWDVSERAGAEWANVSSVPFSWGSGTFLPDGRSIVVVDPDGRISRRDVRTGEAIDRFDIGEEPGAPVRIALSSDGTVLAAGLESAVHLVDLGTGERIGAADDGGTGFVTDLAWTADSEHLAVARAVDDHGEVTVVRRDGSSVARLREPSDHYVDQLDFTPDGEQLVTSRSLPRQAPGLDGIQVWDWRAERVISGIESLPGSIDVDPSGTRVAATGVLSGPVDVFDLATGERVFSVRGPRGTYGVSYSADGSTLATAGADGAVRLWDAASGRLETVLRGHDRAVGRAFFSPDGRRLASLDEAGLVRVWALDVDELITIAHDRLTRELDDDECRQFLRREKCEVG